MATNQNDYLHKMFVLGGGLQNKILKMVLLKYLQ